MKIHVLSLAHTQTTRKFSNCAYTAKVVNFCEMMKMLGHEVILYASEDNDAPVDELVTCITKAEQLEYCAVAGPEDILNPKAGFNEKLPHWQIYNKRAAIELKKRVGEGDILALNQGWMQQSLASVVPQAIAVEIGVGYQGISLRDDIYRAFESETWRAQLMGKFYGAQGVQGRFQDRMIPGFLRLKDFPFVESNKGNYVLYVGRMNEDKGVGVAAMAAKKTGVKLITAGIGSTIPNEKLHKGHVGPIGRAKLMGGALALLAPSIYMEPFGNVVIEAQACGTPTITTDFGAFVETNNDGVTGFRCNTMDEFAEAITKASSISRKECRWNAESYSLENVAPLYEEWFNSLKAERSRGSWLSFSE